MENEEIVDFECGGSRGGKKEASVITEWQHCRCLFEVFDRDGEVGVGKGGDGGRAWISWVGKIQGMWL